MKTIGIIVLLLFVVCAGVSGVELALQVGLDWMLGARAGVECLFAPRFGVQTHVGGSIAGSINSDLFLLYEIYSPSPRFSLRVLAGVPNAVFPIGANAFMVSLGGAAEALWRFKRGLGFSVRIGEGYPFFFENLQYNGKGVAYPLGLWPDLFLSLRIPM